MKAAGKITQEDPPIADVKLWQPAMVQQGLRSTMQILEVLIGPPMGIGCPDRVVAMMNQWSVQDDRFRAWAKEFAEQASGSTRTPPS